MRMTWMILVLALVGLNAFAAEPQAVMLEDMTWTEVQQAVKSGATAVIGPIGGTEQNGPHMALGKHNARIRVDRKSTRLNSSHLRLSRMPSSA